MSERKSSRQRKNELQSRREFNQKLGKVAIGLGVAAGIGIPAYLTYKERQRSEITASKEKLLETIEDLPATPFKTILQKNVAPIFSAQPPKSIQLGPVAIPLINSQIDEQAHELPAILGTVRMHEEQQGKVTPRYTVAVAQDVKVPYSFLTTPAENNERGFPDVMNDVPLMEFNFSAGDKLYSGITPHIIIRSPNTNNYSPEQQIFAAESRVTLIKEAATIFYNLQWLKETALQMEQLGSPTHISTIDINGSTQQTEILTTIDLVFNQASGRYAAYNDIAGGIFALKAYEGTEELAIMQQAESNFNFYISELPHIQLGETETDVLKNSYQAILYNQHNEQNLYAAPELKQNMNNIP